MNAPSRRDQTSPSMALRFIAAALGLAFLSIGLREVFSPAGWDASYGVALAGSDGLDFVRAVGARNVGLSLVALAAAALGARSVMVCAYAATCVIAILDFGIVSAASGPDRAVKHAVFIVAMGALAVWAARSRRSRAIAVQPDPKGH